MIYTNVYLYEMKDKPDSVGALQNLLTINHEMGNNKTRHNMSVKLSTLSNIQKNLIN